jgi:hypothetical protein
MTPLTFDDVILDWAVAELMSPTWAARWTGPLCDNLQEIIESSGVATLNQLQRAWLIQHLCNVRSPIIQSYGPADGWDFRRATIAREELSLFATMEQWSRYPSLGEFATKLRDDPSPDELDMHRHVLAISDKLVDGQITWGIPVAVSRGVSNPPVLIEGYKRSLAVLWGSNASIEMHLCAPPAFAM